MGGGPVGRVAPAAQLHGLEIADDLIAEPFWVVYDVARRGGNNSEKQKEKVVRLDHHYEGFPWRWRIHLTGTLER